MATFPDHLLDKRKYLFHSGFDHARQRLTAQDLRNPVTESGHLELLGRIGKNHPLTE